MISTVEVNEHAKINVFINLPPENVILASWKLCKTKKIVFLSHSLKKPTSAYLLAISSGQCPFFPSAINRYKVLAFLVLIQMAEMRCQPPADCADRK